MYNQFWARFWVLGMGFECKLTRDAPLERRESSDNESEEEAQVDGEGVEVAVGAAPAHEGDLVQEQEVGRHVDAGAETAGGPSRRKRSETF